MDFELHAVHLKEFGVLLDDGVLGLREDVAEGFLVEGIEVGKHGEASDDFGDKTEALQVLRADVLHEV